MFFKDYPKVQYFFGENNFSTPFQDLTIYVDVLDQLKDDASVYQRYTVRDGERPDVVSQRLYGAPDYYWTFYYLNPEIRRRGWPLSQQRLLEVLNRDFPGACLTFFGSSVNPATGERQHELVGKFPVGQPVYGSLSGASGVVYDRNVMLGQLYVRVTSGAFRVNELLVDRLGSAPDTQLQIRQLANPAYTAIREVRRPTGEIVDVDFSVDFRGRPPEGPADLPGGVFDDPVNPDIFASNSPYRRITHSQYYAELNDGLSQLRVLRPEVVVQLPTLFRRALQS